MAYNIDRLLGLFEDRDVYLKRLNKKTYESNMQEFRSMYGPEIDGVLQFVSGSEDIKSAAESVAEDFSRKAFDKYQKRGKIGGTLMMDINFMMVYYVFPYLIGQKGEDTQAAAVTAEVLKDKWNEILGCNISYASYEDLYAGFRKKLFGFF